MANSVEAKLSKLLKRYAETQVDLSWEGSQPVEEFERIEGDADKAKQALAAYLFDNWGLEVNL